MKNYQDSGYAVLSNGEQVSIEYITVPNWPQTVVKAVGNTPHRIVIINATDPPGLATLKAIATVLNDWGALL